MISLKEVDLQNVFDICELTTNPNGIGTVMEEYLCCNAISVAESKYYPEMHPKAIYNNEMLIGFVMYKRTSDEPGTAAVCRFMLDYKFQHKGLGRKAFECILKHFKSLGISKAVVMIDENNVTAKKLYCSFGFEFTGKIDKDEHYYALAL